MAVVLKPFLYAGDGFTVESLVAGDEREFGSATAGLVDAGLIDGNGVVIEKAQEPEAGEQSAADEGAAEPEEAAKPKKATK